MLEVALSMAGRPALLLLDEPMAGLSAAERSLMLRHLDRLDRAIAVLMIEHDMDVAFGFAETVTVLDQGRVLFEGIERRGQRERRRAANLPRRAGSMTLQTTMLQLADVHTYYGDSHVLQGVTFDVAKGSVTAVLGRNGVGKTTMCRIDRGVYAGAGRPRAVWRRRHHEVCRRTGSTACISASCRRGAGCSRR